MQFYTSYVRQLEHLILETLLPVYEKYNKQQGLPNPLIGINEDLLNKVKIKKQLPALLCKKST